LSLVATLLGGHTKIKPKIDDALEAVVKASHIKGVKPDQKSWSFRLRVL